jgi:hypothetical protein
MDPTRPARHQVPPLPASAGSGVHWTVDNTPLSQWQPSPGAYILRAELGGVRDEIKIVFE